MLVNMNYKKPTADACHSATADIAVRVKGYVHSTGSLVKVLKKKIFL
jgi:hypothetical protein